LLREGGRLIDGAAKRVVRPTLKALVTEASRALAQLDAARLEELALSCAALNREMPPVTMSESETLVREAREAVGEMAVFARVLEATRGNLRVMDRLRELRMGCLEYSDRPVPAGGWTPAKTAGTCDRSGDGDD